MVDSDGRKGPDEERDQSWEFFTLFFVSTVREERELRSYSIVWYCFSSYHLLAHGLVLNSRVKSFKSH